MERNFKIRIRFSFYSFSFCLSLVGKYPNYLSIYMIWYYLYSCNWVPMMFVFTSSFKSTPQVPTPPRAPPSPPWRRGWSPPWMARIGFRHGWRHPWKGPPSPQRKTRRANPSLWVCIVLFVWNNSADNLVGGVDDLICIISSQAFPVRFLHTANIDISI